MNGKPDTALCVLTIGFECLVLPMSTALKVADLLRHAQFAEWQPSSRVSKYQVKEGAELKVERIRPDQVIQPKVKP